MTVFQDFQKKIGVNPDGRWGPQTYRAGAKYLSLNNAEAAHFFGNCAHETGDFTVFSENLNYRAEALMRQWRKHFPNSIVARAYAHQPEKIANRAYANRMGNGNEASGDGWKYRGRGAIQTTGKDNYQDFADSGHPEVMDNPGLLADELAFEAGSFFFRHNKIYRDCQDIRPNTIINVRSLLNRGRPWSPGEPTSGIIGLNDVLIRVPKYYGWGL